LSERKPSTDGRRFGIKPTANPTPLQAATFKDRLR
jgi:hypothetical protein